MIADIQSWRWWSCHPTTSACWCWRFRWKNERICVATFQIENHLWWSHFHLMNQIWSQFFDGHHNTLISVIIAILIQTVNYIFFYRCAYPPASLQFFRGFFGFYSVVEVNSPFCPYSVLKYHLWFEKLMVHQHPPLQCLPSLVCRLLWCLYWHSEYWIICFCEIKNNNLIVN